MELIRGLHNLKKQSGCVVTIGNFDGIHIGHQEILKNLVTQENALQNRIYLKNLINSAIKAYAG